MKHLRAVLVVFLLIGWAAAQEFSAKFIWSENKDIHGTLYVSGSRFRADVVQDGKLEVLLLDAGKKPALTHVEPGDKKYSVLELHEEKEIVLILRWLTSTEKELCDLPGLSSCKFLGLNSVEDRVCDQFELTEKSGETHKVCFDHDLHFGLAYEGDEDKITLTDIKLGKQPGWLFVVPKKFEKKPFF